MESYKEIVNIIYNKGYYTYPDFYSKDEFDELFQHALSVKNIDVARNFDHPAYKSAVNEKLKEFLFEVAREKCKFLPDVVRGEEYISAENIALAFHRKGPSYGNTKRAKNAYHYDDALVTGVFSFSLPPQSSQACGLNVYKNLKYKLGMRNCAKILSRFLIEIPFFRKFIKPVFIPYKVGSFTFFFGDVSLHGVEDCVEGDRVAFAVQLSQVDLNEFKRKFKDKNGNYKSHSYLKSL
jgi:hypothetical protein